MSSMNVALNMAYLNLRSITEPLKKLYLIEHMRVQQLFLIIEHILTAGYQ